jgi:ABC-2 type transport system permease protein
MTSFISEVRKVPAFARRNLVLNWSYRTAFFLDFVNLGMQIVLFAFLDRLIDPNATPTYGDEPASYLAFVSVGIAFGAFLALGLGQIASALRNEQLMGTLEALLMTPTRISTMQLGLAAYDFIYVPIRTLIFLSAVSLILDVGFQTEGIGATMAMLLVFIPFVWGLGLLGSAAVLTFKRGGGGLGILAAAISISSGAYFPLEILPEWIQTLSTLNPVARALDASRRALLGGETLSTLMPDLAFVAASAVVALVAGVVASALAVRRERRRGSLLGY